MVHNAAGGPLCITASAISITPLKFTKGGLHVLTEGQDMVQVPSDAEMLLSTIKMERKAQLAIPPLPSTFAADVAAITGTPHASTHLAGPLLQALTI